MGRDRYTDDDIRASWVTEPPRLDSTVTLAEYDPAWPALFEREARRIRDVLGDAALLCEHIGSTSVPGLCAKPIIDVLLAVADSGAEQAYVPALEGAGYRLVIREPDRGEHRVCKGPDTDVNLHVYSWGRPEIERYLVFRDHLRSDEADRAAYARSKRELAARRWTYIQHYADAKNEIIDSIMARACAR